MQVQKNFESANSLFSW